MQIISLLYIMRKVNQVRENTQDWEMSNKVAHSSATNRWICFHNKCHNLIFQRLKIILTCNDIVLPWHYIILTENLDPWDLWILDKLIPKKPGCSSVKPSLFTFYLNLSQVLRTWTKDFSWRFFPQDFSWRKFPKIIPKEKSRR